jgi:protein SCO1/2
MQFAIDFCTHAQRRAVLTIAFLGLVVLGIGGQSGLAGEATKRPAQLLDVGIDQRLNEQVPLELSFRDEEGRTVRLGDFFGEKPVILSLVYFACPMLCTTAENGLLEAVKQLKFDAGKEFEILTVSFDPNDKPMNAKAKKSVYVGLYGRPGGAEGWHFLTGDQESIRSLTESVGFHYTYDEASREFAHATGIMVITPTGRTSHYFYGIQYPAGDLRLALVEASNNKIGNPVDAVLLFCSHYDPAIGKYGFVISRVLQLAGLVTVLSIATLLLVMFWTERRARARLEQPL